MKTAPALLSRSRCSRRWISLAALFGLALSLPRALEAATLSGRITAMASGDYLQGAVVVASDGKRNYEAVTGTDGWYRIDGVPAGQYFLRASYLSYGDKVESITVTDQKRLARDFALEAEGAIVLAPFVVEGVAEGQAKAINQQKNSDTIISVISSDSAGALPDQTIGQALNRLAGINVVDDSEISIRGSEGKLNTISLDGVSLSSPKSAIGQDETRAIDLAAIPTAMIESIEVYKVLTPDMDASSFGGTVNLKTRSSFDYKRDIYQASIEGQRGSYHANYPHQPDQFTFNASVGKRITDKFGFLVAGMYRAGQSFGETEALVYYSAGNATLNRNANITDQGLQEVDRWVTATRSKQFAVNATLDWRPTVDTKLYFKFNVGSTFDDSQTWRARLRDIAGYDDAATPTYETGSRASVASGSGLIQSSAAVHYRPVKGTSHTPTMGFNFGGETRFNSLLLSYQLAETYSQGRQRQRRAGFYTSNIAVQRSYNWTIDRSDPRFPVVNITQRTTGENLLDRPQDAMLDTLRVWNGDKDDYKVLGRIDAEQPFLWRFPTKFKVGVKVNDTRRIQENSLQDWTIGSVTINPATGLGTETIVPTPMSNFEMSSYVPRGTFNGAAPTLGSQPDVDKAFQYMANNSSLFYNMTEVPKKSPNGGNEYQYFKSNIFTLNERITSGYAMATTDFGKLRSVAGLRYEYTKQTGDWEGAASKKQADGGTQYGNLFPSMMLTYGVTKNQKVRLSYSTAITRANLTDLLKRNSIAASNANADPELLSTPGTYAIGNPDLKPQRTQNFDLSYELYYQPTGLLSAQVFKKHITDFIYTTQVSEDRDYISAIDPVTGAPIIRRGTYKIQQPVNGSLQEIYGLELSLQQNLKKVNFLPEALRGLGVQGTVTFLRGKNTVYEQDGGTNGPLVPVTTYYLISQPSKMYNAQLYWDYKQFTARIAYNHRDSFRRVAANRQNLLLGVKINDDIDQWSFKATYRFTRNWQLFFSGRNIFKEYSSATYQDRPDLPLSYGYSGMTLSGGLRLDF